MELWQRIILSIVHFLFRNKEHRNIFRPRKFVRHFYVFHFLVCWSINFLQILCLFFLGNDTTKILACILHAHTLPCEAL